MNKFNNGATVRVIDKGEQYSSYTDFIKKHANNYMSEWKRGCRIENGAVGIVVCQAKHLRDGNNLYIIKNEDGVFIIGENGLELIDYPKILITTDGTTTLARMYNGNAVIKTATAKCCSEDTFDFEIGARLAMDRLIGEKPAQDKPTPEPPKATFDWKNFKSEKIAVHCDTEEKAKAFLKEAKAHGLTWGDGGQREVMCYFADGVMESFNIYHIRAWNERRRKIGANDLITHFMPQPEPPEKGK